MSESALELQGVVVDYGGGPVVHGVDLAVAPGEVVSLLGANGSGRTSVLRAATGFAPMPSGRVALDGEDLRGRSPEARARDGLFLIPEDRGLFPALTVNDHLRLALHRLPRQEELDTVFETFPRLRERAGQTAGSLSGGEAQMLSMALALLVQPRFLFVDELSFGLAPNIVGQLLGVCRQLADSGMGVILVEQFVDLALGVADRAVVLSNGVVTFEGTAESAAASRELLERAYLGSGKDDA